MSIKIILNGYYRSGTTFLWKYLKDSFPEHISFYEPLHTELALSIHQEEKGGENNRLHGEFLWQEYLNLTSEKLSQIIAHNPNANKEGIKSEQDLLTYLDLFEEMKEKVILQPNRLHFFIDTVSKEYNSKMIHVIRHPLDVYASMKKAYLNVKSPVYKIAKKLFYPGFWISPGFDLSKEYRWINENKKYPIDKRCNWFNKYFSLDHFGKFVVIWTISNYYAIKSIEKNKGLILVYEELVDNPKKISKDLEKFLKTKFENPIRVKRKNSFKFSNSELKRLVRAVKKYKIEKEFRYVIDRAKKRKINYLKKHYL